MVIDAEGIGFSLTYLEEPSNAVVQKLFDMLRAANQQVLAIKILHNYQLSHEC